ncbi:MAG: RIP metalloprotease RseP [Elusimicrobiota bacterium]
MAYVISFLGVVFAFGLVIFVHEFGHFIVAKKSGVKVERFSFGLGPEMFGFQWGETKYCVAWLPLGGEVRMAGEFGEEEKVEDPPRDKSRDFFSQPWYRRIAIAFAGPFMNYILAIIIFFGILFINGEPNQTNKTQIGEILAGMPADLAGVKTGDTILKVQGEAVVDFFDMAQKIQARPNQQTDLLIFRDNQELTLSVTPKADEGQKTGLIGIRPADPIYERKKIGVVQSLTLSLRQCWTISSTTVYYLWKKISEREKPDLAGPLGITQVIVKAVKSGWEDFFGLIGMISVAIGLFNLFPIPMLDGGHVVYYVIEGIRGKPVSQKIMGKANMVGMALLLSLLVFATLNDVQRFRGSKKAPETESSSSKKIQE